MKKTNYIYFFPILLILSIGLGYYLKEDSLGGAQHDYLFHKKFFFLFLNDFKQTFLSYGSEELSARNSPIFYMIFAFLLKIGFTIESLKYINSLILIGYFAVFTKCLTIKYNNINVSYQILFRHHHHQTNLLRLLLQISHRCLQTNHHRYPIHHRADRHHHWIGKYLFALLWER